MKIFQEIRKHFAVLGIYEPTNNEFNILNRRNMSILLLFILCLISGTAFILFDARSFREFAEAFFIWITLISSNTGLVVGIAKNYDIYRLFTNLEKTIENRKFRCKLHAFLVHREFGKTITLFRWILWFFNRIRWPHFKEKLRTNECQNWKMDKHFLFHFVQSVTDNWQYSTDMRIVLFVLHNGFGWRCVFRIRFCQVI